MIAVLFPERLGFARAGCSIGLVLTWLTNGPIGLLAAVAAVLALIIERGSRGRDGPK
jgi:hypothetical protein